MADVTNTAECYYDIIFHSCLLELRDYAVGLSVLLGIYKVYFKIRVALQQLLPRRK